jgi:ribosomal protein S28E/S33
LFKDAQLDYYQALLDTMGRPAVDQFARLFVIPQAGHGLSGSVYGTDGEGRATTPGPVPSDYERFAYLVAWVERGIAPRQALEVSAGGKDAAALLVSDLSKIRQRPAGGGLLLHLQCTQLTAWTIGPGSAFRSDPRARGQLVGDLVEDPFRDDPVGHEIVGADERTCRNDSCRTDAADPSQQPDLMFARCSGDLSPTRDASCSSSSISPVNQESRSSIPSTSSRRPLSTGRFRFGTNPGRRVWTIAFKRWRSAEKTIGATSRPARSVEVVDETGESRNYARVEVRVLAGRWKNTARVLTLGAVRPTLGRSHEASALCTTTRRHDETTTGLNSKSPG